MALHRALYPDKKQHFMIVQLHFISNVLEFIQQFLSAKCRLKIMKND